MKQVYDITPSALSELLAFVMSVVSEWIHAVLSFDVNQFKYSNCIDTVVIYSY